MQALPGTVGWSVLDVIVVREVKEIPEDLLLLRLLTAGGDPSVTDPTSGVTSVDIKTKPTFHLRKITLEIFKNKCFSAFIN